MSAFEKAAWNWYHDTVWPFSMEAGIVAEAFKDLRLKEAHEEALSAGRELGSSDLRAHPGGSGQAGYGRREKPEIALADIKYLITVDDAGAVKSVKNFDETLSDLAKHSDTAKTAHGGLWKDIALGQSRL